MHAVVETLRRFIRNKCGGKRQKHCNDRRYTRSRDYKVTPNALEEQRKDKGGSCCRKDNDCRLLTEFKNKSQRKNIVKPITVNGRAISQYQLFEEKRKLLEEHDIVALRRVTLCEDRRLGDYVCIELIGKGNDCREGFAGADNIVNDKYFLAAKLISVLSAEKEGLLCIGGYRTHADTDGVGHIDLRLLAGDKIFLAALSGHLIGKRDALRLGSENIIELRALLEQLFRRFNGDFDITERMNAAISSLSLTGQRGSSLFTPAISIV